MSEEKKGEPTGEISEAAGEVQEARETPEVSAAEAAQGQTPEAAAEAPREQEAPAASAEAAAAPEPAAAAAPAAEPPAAPPAAGAGEEPVRRKETDEEKAARRKAALEAREAAKAAAAQAAGGSGSPAAASARPGAAAAASAAAGDGAPGAASAEAPPKPPSPNQPRLDRAVQLLRELVAEDAVEEASINEPNDHLPTLTVRNERWTAAANLLRSHQEFGLNYLRNVTGVDHESHMEVVYHLLSLDSGHVYAIRVRTDREAPRIPSATPIWQTANWHEREIYDLLGIDFPGHPDLRRIMMPDDWVGHPLRKDYVPLDPEV